MVMTAPARDYDVPPTPPEEVEVETIDEAFDQLSVPLGFRAEIIDGEIVVAPPPDGDHEESIATFIEQFNLHGAGRIRLSTNRGIITPNGRCIPDITVATRGTFRGQTSWSEPVGVLLVCEVTSNHADRDRVLKRHRYAAAGIPLYLLVDRDEDTVTLLSDPNTKIPDYRTQYTVEYGEKLSLPEPFGFELDTSELP